MNADLCIVIARNPLPFFIGAAPILAEARATTQLLAARQMVIANLHGMRVVERHCPRRSQRASDRVALRHRVSIRRELVDIGENEISDAHPNSLALPARIDVNHANWRFHPVPLTQLSEVLSKSFTSRQSMQEGQVRRIHAVLFDLEPV